MVYDSLDITAVTSEGLITRRILLGILGRVIGRITVGETVWYDKVDQVLGSETLTRTLSLLSHDIRIAEALLAFLEDNVIDTFLGIRSNLDIHKDEIRIVCLMDLQNLETLLRERHFIAADTRSLDHELKLCPHSCPPAWRLHTRHLVLGRRLDLSLQRQRDKRCRHRHQ